MTADCVLCKIVEGQIPSSKVYEEDKYLAFMDAFPATDGHVLVITKEHYEDIYSIPTDLYSGLSRIVKNVAVAVKKTFNPEGVKIDQFNGKAVGQSVPHFHVHIVPHYEGDNFQPGKGFVWWTPRKYANDEERKAAARQRDEFASRIKANLS